MKNKDFNLQEKEIYKLFNEIKIEESEFEDMDEEINDIQKAKIKKNLNQRIKEKKNFKALKYGSAAAAIALVCLVGIGTASPSFAKNVPVLGSIIQTINNKFGHHVDYADYSQVINKSVTDNGITFTINEVIADDSKLIIGYTIKSDKKLNDLEVFGLGRFMKINGEYFGSGGSSAGNHIDDYTYISSEEIHTTIPRNSERFNVDLNIDEISNVKGKWDLAFSASKEEICKESIVFKPNKKLDFPETISTIDKVVFSPIDTSIFISGNYKNKNINLQDAILGDYFIVYDDMGVDLTSTGSGIRSGNKEQFNSEMNFVKQNHISKYLTVIPCKIIPSGGGGVSMDENGKETPIVIETKKPKEISKVIDGVYPIELAQGKMGKLIIKEIKIENNQTIVKYTAEGKAPYFQAQDLLIKDNKGETLKIKDYNIRKDEKNPNEFTKAFEALDSNKKYTIYTNDFSNVELREDLKFKIELKK